TLKNKGLDENTIVMFSSDNGPHKEGGANPDYFDSNGALRGAKRDLYEGGIRVPFIVRWPDKIAAGRESNHISAFWDVLPTLAELAGADIDDVSTEGISILPTLLGKEKQQVKHDYLYWEFHEDQYSHQAVRKGKWKAVRKDPKGPIALFNLENDISETKDLSEDNGALVTEMEEIMKGARTENPYWKLKSSAE